MDEQILHRIESLEANQSEIRTTQKQILDGLFRIERRLVGNIEEDKPGLLDDMRFLRRTVESIDARIVLIEKSNMQSRLESLESELKGVQAKMDDLNKYRWVLYGGILVVAFALEKLWNYIVK